MRARLLLSALVVGLGFPYLALERAEAARASSDEGEAWTPVSPEDRVIATAWGTETALLRKVHLLTWEGSDARPGFTSSLLVGRDGDKIPVQTVRVLEGRVDAVLVPDTKERGVLLAGPDAISAIANRGRISLSVTKDKVYVQSLRHEALVGHRGIFKKLPPNVIRVFERSSGRSEDLTPAPPPALESTAALSVAMTGGAELGVVAKGQGDVCIALQDAAGIAVGEASCVEAGTETILHAPQAGTYSAVARSMGPGRLDGALSRPLTLKVLGLADGQAPPQDGVFLLEQFERVRLRGTEGLQMRIGTSKLYVDATDSIGLAQGQPTLVEFRAPESPEQSTKIRLAPKIGNVKTSIGPAGAIWPGRPAQISVSVRDGTGKLIDETDGLRLSVSINSQEVETRFRRTSSGLIADVPSQNGAGPWVVRLHVYDKNDRILARDFLEVIAKK